MVNNSNNNDMSDDNQSQDQLDIESILAESWPLCPNCLEPCNPLQNYCQNCDSNEVVNPLACYMPFVRLRFAYGFFGKIWRLIWYDQCASTIFRIAYLLMIGLFAPILLIVGVPLLVSGKIAKPKLARTTAVFIYVISVIILLILIYLYLVDVPIHTWHKSLV